MARYGMVIDETKCVGCHACRVACQNQNGLSAKESYNHLEEREYGAFPNYNREFIPVQCQHCDNPPCVKVCPTGASYKRTDGIVLVDKDKCIGCKYCIAACPYNVRIIKPEGYIEKCRFCLGLLEKDDKPACVSTCMTKVRTFGDLDDPNSEVSRMIVKQRLKQFKADLNTRPRIYYKRA
ncbi:MAG: 4Fe-4S dicluster domain-containing protein [Syntrophaceae bacterium]|jgi:Fe-S-cluster-containing dehydrogenase component|nr:4Fe-4S dicluster domain-containing protein [Syntrophaceae bacterium]